MSNIDPISQPPTPMIQPRESGLAIASLVTGIASWIILPLLGSLAAVITGHMAKKEIRNSGGMISGRGMATAGLILGYVQLGFAILAICVIVVLIALAPGVQDVFNNINSSLY